MGSDYQERLCNHLADYKVNTLGIQPPGVFRFRGESFEKPHILPEDQRWLNILPQVREAVQSYVRDNPHVRLHRYFHHLNSSQAFALNLFVPFFQAGAGASHSLLAALGQSGSVAPGSWGVEIVPVPEENTNIDATWTTTSGDEWICEVKLSENEFGKAENDDEHKEKLANTYAPLLRNHIPSPFLSPDFFFSHYQIFRNIWHMLRRDRCRLLFLMPRANASLWTQLDDVLKGLSQETTQRISLQSIEDVLTKLSADSECPVHLRSFAGLLADKYVCAPDAA